VQVENEQCTIVHNWNVINWNGFKTEFCNGKGKREDELWLLASSVQIKRRCPNLEKLTNTIKNYCCTIEHNWNPIDWGAFSPRTLRWELSLKTHNSYLEMGACTIEAPFIPVAEWANLLPAPSQYLGCRLVQLKIFTGQRSTSRASQIEASQFHLHIQKIVHVFLQISSTYVEFRFSHQGTEQDKLYNRMGRLTNCPPSCLMY